MESYLSNLFGLKGRTALITGGARGIGKALVIALASAGADVVLIVRDVDTCQPLKEEVEKLGRKAFLYQCDLHNRDKLLEIVPTISNDGLEIDIFVHCAGIQHRSPAEDFADARWDEVINVNLTAGFQLSRDLGKHWLDTSLKGYTDGDGKRRKKIVFISSVTSVAANVQIPAYASSKGAIVQLTRALNNEWMSKGINVNALAPGYIATELTSGIRDGGSKEQAIMGRTPAGRWGAPEDLAGALVHLCARSGDWIGGENHVVDGGYLGR